MSVLFALQFIPYMFLLSPLSLHLLLGLLKRLPGMFVLPAHVLYEHILGPGLFGFGLRLPLELLDPLRELLHLREHRLVVVP